MNPTLASLPHARTKQHGQYQALNYYAKVSKYDLDRGLMNMSRAKIEK